MWASLALTYTPDLQSDTSDGSEERTDGRPGSNLEYAHGSTPPSFTRMGRTRLACSANSILAEEDTSIASIYI